MTTECRQCRHQLSGLTVGRCPECATPLTPRQRVEVGLPPKTTAHERIVLLMERASVYRRLDIARALELVPNEAALHAMTAATAALFFERHADAARLFALLRKSGYPVPDAFVATLQFQAYAEGDRFDDVAALRILPPLRTCRDLYDRLRRLGYSEFDALECILPHRGSFAPAEKGTGEWWRR